MLGSNYSVTVGGGDNVTADTLNIFWSASATTSSSFVIDGSLTANSILFTNIGLPGSALPTDFTVDPGGLLFAGASLNSTRDQTITIAGTGTGGHLELGGQSVGVGGIGSWHYDF